MKQYDKSDEIVLLFAMMANVLNDFLEWNHKCTIGHVPGDLIMKAQAILIEYNKLIKGNNNETT